MKFFVLILITLLSPAQAVHADNTSLGGNLVVCSGQETVVLDYYHAALKAFRSAESPAIDVSQMSTNGVLNFILNRMKNKTSFYRLFKAALEEVGPVANWIQADLKDVSDSQEPYFLPNTCNRVQGAARVNGVMYIDPRSATLLSQGQLGVLVAHEALYLIAAARGQNNSENVRTFLRVILAKNFSRKDMNAAIGGLGCLP